MTTTTTAADPAWLSTMQDNLDGSAEQLRAVLQTIADTGDENSRRLAGVGLYLHWRMTTQADTALDNLRMADAEVRRIAS